jgi:hypothetical protein
MTGQSKEDKALRETEVIIWDEVPRAPKAALETVDSLLKDLIR